MHAEADRDTTARPFVYLVLLRQALVAEDIALTIADFEPGAEIHRASKAQDIPQGLHFDVGFIGIGLSQPENTTLAAALEARGTQVVLIGDDAVPVAAVARGWALPLPFTTDSVVALLSRARTFRGI